MILKNKIWKIFIACLSFLFAAKALAAEGKIEVLNGGDTRPCIFFTMANVPVAAPEVPNTPWFALAKTHPNYKETYALLLAAKLTDRNVIVNTVGVNSCGHANVSAVILTK